MKTKVLVIVGIVLIVAGVAALAYQGITYVSRDTVVDVGPVHITAAREHTIPLSPIIGGAALVGGLAFVILGARGKQTNSN